MRSKFRFSFYTRAPILLVTLYGLVCRISKSWRRLIVLDLLQNFSNLRKTKCNYDRKYDVKSFDKKFNILYQ